MLLLFPDRSLLIAFCCYFAKFSSRFRRLTHCVCQTASSERHHIKWLLRAADLNTLLVCHFVLDIFQAQSPIIFERRWKLDALDSEENRKSKYIINTPLYLHDYELLQSIVNAQNRSWLRISRGRIFFLFTHPLTWFDFFRLSQTLRYELNIMMMVWLKAHKACL